mgnify:CR=1 FL=1
MAIEMVKKGNQKVPDVPTSEEFSRTMGQVAWLMTLSKKHRDLPISYQETHLAAPLMFKQVRVFTKGKQPLAAVIWAYVSPEIKQKLEAGDYTMQLEDWRSGPEVAIVDCISPLVDPKVFVDQFLSQVEDARKSI